MAELTVVEAKIVVQESLDKLKKSIERQVTYEKELQDDKLTLQTLEQMKSDGDPLPDPCAYTSYDEWIEQINGEIKSSETSLARIDREKAEIKAFEYFIANATDE